MTHRIGRVSAQDPERGRVRVTFDAEQALVSWWLPVLQPKTLHDQVYWMPDLDEHVVCLLDVHAESGVVLGAIYSAAAMPPVADLDRLHVRMKDGTTIEYDRASHRLEVTLAAAGAAIVLNVPEDGHVHVGGEAGQELATRSFVETIFNVHTHPTPAGPSGPPAQQAPLEPGGDITLKQRSE